ncbi:MAG: phage tail tube protein [Paracoccus sp. (in: a-proteobacteria)]
MAELASQAEVAWNDELWIGPTTPAGDTVTAWTQVFGIEELNTPERTPDDIDVTHMQSPGRNRETIPGLMSAADWSQDLQYWPTHSSQLLLDELATLTETGEKEDFLVEFNVGGIRRTYRAYVNTFTPQGSVGEKRMAALSLKVFERRPTNPRPLVP